MSTADELSAPPLASERESTKPHTSARRAYRVGFVVTMLAVISGVVLTPFIIVSIVASLHKPVSDRAFELTSGHAVKNGLEVNIEAVTLDEVNEQVTLRISGNRVCATVCDGALALRVYALHVDPTGSQGAPPSHLVAFPSDGSEVDATVTLPLAGSAGGYPFDTYRLRLGIGLDSTAPGRAPIAEPSVVARRELDVSLGERIPRVDLARPGALVPGYRLGAGLPSVSSTDLVFSRPLYLQALSVIIVVFILLAGVYSVSFRPFRDVIGTAGMIVLGVWGVRILLLGTLPPNVAGLDFVLLLIVLLLLMIISVRGLFHLWRGAKHTEPPTS